MSATPPDASDPPGHGPDETEVLFRAAIDTVGLGIWIHDVVTGRVRSTPRMRQLAGFPPDEEVPDITSWAARIHPDELPRLTEQYGRVMAAGFPLGEVAYDNSYRNVHADGRVVHVLYFGRMIFDAQGKVLRVIGTALDVTEQRQTVEALRSSEANYRRLVELSPDAILVHEDGLITIANTAAVRLFGAQSARELIGLPIFERIVPEHREQARLRVAAIRSLGVPSPLALQRWLRLDGSFLELEVTGALVSRSERAAVQVILRDVAQRRRAELLLKEREEFFRALIEHSDDLVLLADGDSRITYASPSVAKVLGHSPDELVGLALGALAAGDDRALLKAAVLAARGRPGNVRRVELRLGVPGAAARDVEVTLSNRAEDPAVRALVLNVRDVSARRALEAQLRQSQKMDAVGRLAGGVAHDFNNLLTVILSYAELLLAKTPPGAPDADDLVQIREAAQQAADLTRQLLMFSRQQVLEPLVLDLNDALSTMDKMLKRILGEDIELVTLLAPKLGLVRADPGSLEQVIMNLAVNARDAMPSGGRLTMETADVVLDEEYARLHLGVAPGPHVMLAVSDTGVGMDKTVQARIFEPFFTTKEKGKGTGLGLATVFAIVQQSGGSIWVYSEQGKGSTFKVYFPAALGAVADSKPTLPAASLRGTETILLVEDEARVREVAANILRLHGYDVLETQGPLEAIRLCESHAGTIDLLVTDVVMPVLSGPKLAERLRSLRPGLKVLCMSGYTDDSVVRHGFMDAKLAFLQKPFTPETLARKVRETLGPPH